MGARPPPPAPPTKTPRPPPAPAQLEVVPLPRLDGARDESVEAPAELVRGTIDERGGVVADVARDEHGAAAELLDLVRDRTRGVRAACVADRDVEAVGGE